MATLISRTSRLILRRVSVPQFAHLKLCLFISKVLNLYFLSFDLINLIY